MSARPSKGESAATLPLGFDIRSPNDLGPDREQTVHGRTASVPADNADAAARRAAGGHSGSEVDDTARTAGASAPDNFRGTPTPKRSPGVSSPHASRECGTGSHLTA